LLSSGLTRLLLFIFLLSKASTLRLQELGPVGSWSQHDVLFRIFRNHSIVELDLPNDRVSHTYRRVGTVVLLLIPVVQLQQAQPVRFYLVHAWVGEYRGRERIDGPRRTRVNDRALRTFSFG
jgi:hypothetical protein